MFRIFVELYMLGGLDYSYAERQKFIPIFQACVDENMVLAKQLIIGLSEFEQERFKTFYDQERAKYKDNLSTQEKQLITEEEKITKEFQVKMQGHQQKIAQLDTDIEDLERKEKLVFSEGAKQTAKKQMTFSKDTAHAVVTKRKHTPGGSKENCVVM